MLLRRNVPKGFRRKRSQFEIESQNIKKIIDDFLRKTVKIPKENLRISVKIFNKNQIKKR